MTFDSDSPVSCTGCERDPTDGEWRHWITLDTGGPLETPLCWDCASKMGYVRVDTGRRQPRIFHRDDITPELRGHVLDE